MYRTRDFSQNAVLTELNLEAPPGVALREEFDQAIYTAVANLFGKDVPISFNQAHDHAG